MPSHSERVRRNYSSLPDALRGAQTPTEAAPESGPEKASAQMQPVAQSASVPAVS